MSDRKPIIVEPTAGISMFLVGVRQLSLVVGGVLIAGRFWKDRDFVGLMEYLQGDGFATAIGAIVTILIFLYGQFREARQKLEALWMAEWVPDSVAMVGRKPRWWLRPFRRARKE